MPYFSVCYELIFSDFISFLVCQNVSFYLNENERSIFDKFNYLVKIAYSFFILQIYFRYYLFLTLQIGG